MKITPSLALPFGLVLTVAAAAVAQVTGSTALTVGGKSSRQAMLTGCVVNSDNTISSACTTAATNAGYSFVFAESFEGQLGPNEVISSGNYIDGTKPHTGAKSMHGLYTSDGHRVSFFLQTGGHLAPFHELYISYWDYVDPNAMFANSDYFLIDIKAPSAACNGQDFAYDAQYNIPPNPPSRSSNLQTSMMGVSQGANFVSACQGSYQWTQSRQITINTGRWEQKEIHFKPSTSVSTGSDCNGGNGGGWAGHNCHGNGEAELWLNGQLTVENLSANLNGSQDMSQAGLEIGGTISSFRSCTTCGGKAPDGRCNPFSSCTGPGGAACTGPPGTCAPSPYNRYIDDIIVLKK
jgi:hypothetical protein